MGKEKKEMLGVRTEEVLDRIYRRLKAIGDIFMAADNDHGAVVELDVGTLPTFGYELFGMGQELEAIVRPDIELPESAD